jgi:hypothetical protein
MPSDNRWKVVPDVGGCNRIFPITNRLAEDSIVQRTRESTQTAAAQNCRRLLDLLQASSAAGENM